MSHMIRNAGEESLRFQALAFLVCVNRIFTIIHLGLHEANCSKAPY